MRVLLLLGHPRPDSFGAALFEAFRTGLDDAGVEYRAVRLCDLAFDPHVHVPSPADQALEPDLAEAQRLIAWARHLVLVYPTWWGTHPALLKGFLDRVLTPGFAFRFHADGSWDKLLTGKTAELLTTMDTPCWVYRWIYGAPGHRALARATLGFCGVRTVGVQSFGIVERSTAVQRRAWLEAVRRRGRALADDARSRRQRTQERIVAWLRALRLQFYPMTWIAYTVGALLGAAGQPLRQAPYWIGYLCLFALEAATVFSNEYFDYASDRRNTNPGPFNGGSRVLVEGVLAFRHMRAGIGVAVAAFALSSAWLLGAAVAQPGASALVLGVLAVLALGYTVPPLKFSHRGAGEFDVALTHSLGVLLCGFVFQGGSLSAWQPWLAGVPLLLSVVPAITLSGIPDYEADRAAAKRTLVVRIGARRALLVALVCTAAAALAAVLIDALAFGGQLFGGARWLALLHAAVLGVMLLRRLARPEALGRFNILMVVALSFILWFGVLPLLALT